MGRTVPPLLLPAAPPEVPLLVPPLLQVAGPSAPLRFGELVRCGPTAAPADPAPAAAPSRRRTAEDEERRHPDPLDPLTRQAAQLEPPLPGPAPDDAQAAPQLTAARLSLEDLLPAMVRRVAWSGDAQRGTLRLELGAGALAGGTLLVEVEQGRVRVQLRTPPGADVAGWRRRIARRLRLELDAVEVE
jgi:hypothetical protein